MANLASTIWGGFLAWVDVGLGALSVNWGLDEADLVGDNNLDWMTPADGNAVGSVLEGPPGVVAWRARPWQELKSAGDRGVFVSSPRAAASESRRRGCRE